MAYLIVPKNKDMYENIEPGYYHKVMTEGNKIQQFWHKEKFNKVIGCLKPITGKRILDVGCGPGTLISMIPEEYESIQGVDISSNQITFARNLVKCQRAGFLAVDIMDIVCYMKFDHITMVEVIEHMPKNDTKKIFQKIRESLTADGTFIITTPNYRSLWPVIEWVWNKINPINYEEQHINKFTRKRLKAELMQAGFKIESMRTFFIFSQFCNILSPKLAKWIMGIEETLFPQFGSLIIVEAKLAKPL